MCKGLFLPHIEFCNRVWYPRLKKRITLLEKIQWRATRKVSGLTELIQGKRLLNLDLQTLEHRRRRAKMIEMFKKGCNRHDPKATKGLFEQNNRGTRIKFIKVVVKIRAATG